MLYQQGRMLEYEQLAREATGEKDGVLRMLPHGHPVLIEAIVIWIDFVLNQGKYDEAIWFAEKTVEISEVFPEHYQIAAL